MPGRYDLVPRGDVDAEVLGVGLAGFADAVLGVGFAGHFGLDVPCCNQELGG